MARPAVVVEIDGVPANPLFYSSLVSLKIVDREGIQSDTLDLIFADGPPHFQTPRRGAKVRILIDGNYTGDFVINRIDRKCFPFTLRVGGHSADLRSGMKAARSRHWDNATVKKIVEEIAGEYDLKAMISGSVSGHVYEWIGQQDESDLQFLERLSRRHGALFTIKAGRLLWLERRSGKTASAEAIPLATIFAPSIVVGTCRVSETDIDRFATVRAYYQDRDAARRASVVVDGDPGASGETVLQDPFSSLAEAETAARARAREMLSGTVDTSCSVVGRTDLMAGQPMSYSGVHPEIDGRVFVLAVVKTDYSKAGGLRTSFEGKLKVTSD